VLRCAVRVAGHWTLFFSVKLAVWTNGPQTGHSVQNVSAENDTANWRSSSPMNAMSLVTAYRNFDCHVRFK